MRGPIDIKRKGCELIIPDNNRDFRVTMVGRWVDVRDSDRGDFRSWRRRAVDIIVRRAGLLWSQQDFEWR